MGFIEGATLPLVQACLITAAGLITHRLARDLLPQRTANWIGNGYFAGNALISPALGKCTDLYQLPVAMFSLMLGLVERRRWLVPVLGVERLGEQLGDLCTNELTTFKHKPLP